MQLRTIGHALAILLAAASLASAQTVDLTRPGDSIFGTSANFPGAENPPNSIDNNTATKYLNFDKLNAGFTVHPHLGTGIVTGLTITSANDGPERDPASFTLSGSNDGGATFSVIASGALPAFGARFQDQSVSFANTQRYGTYKLIFPTVANVGAANSMQLSEAQLLVNSSTIHSDVTAPGNPVIPTSLNSPGAEGPGNAFDNNVNTKYLNFDKLNTGVTVTPGGKWVVTGLGLTSANDAAERDPASFILSGSLDGINFNTIASGSIPAFNARFFEQDFNFLNNSAYTSFRILFPTVANAGAANSMQIAEIQLFGTQQSNLPEPGTYAIGGLMLLVGGAYGWKKRKTAAKSA